MPVTYDIRSTPPLLYVRYLGFVTPDEVRAAFDDYASGPEFRMDRPQYVDLTRFENTAATYADIVAIAGMLERACTAQGATLSIGIHAPGDLGYGLARMFESACALRPALRSRVFTDGAACLAWVSARGDAIRRRPEPAAAPEPEHEPGE